MRILVEKKTYRFEQPVGVIGYESLGTYERWFLEGDYTKYWSSLDLLTGYMKLKHGDDVEIVDVTEFLPQEV